MSSGPASTVAGIRTAVVVLTYRPPPGMLEVTLRSVVDGSGDADVLVVDNGDARSHLDANSADAERVTWIRTGRNGGFAFGMNIGIAAALDRGADAIALLNDDVEVTEGWLDPLLAELDDPARIGAVQPLLVHAEPDRGGTGRTPVERVNSAGVALDRFGAGADVDRDRPVDTIDPAPHDIEAFTGGAVVLSRAFVEAVGTFDERFFLYYEDVELSRRARRTGWRLRLAPASVVRHRGSATTAALGDEVRRLQERNRLWSSVLHGSAGEIARGLGLSIRRLRHVPRAVHARALGAALVGLPRVAVDRVRRDPPNLVRRVVGRMRSIPERRRARRLRGTPGVNVVGYHHISSGLGSNARELSAALTAAGVPVVEIDNDLSTSPRRRPARPVPTELHDTTIAIVTAFEFALFRDRYPQLFEPGRRMIGYWVWELAEVPPDHRDAMPLVDEIWTPTTFVQDAYRRAAPADIPVRLAPFRMEAPELDPDLAADWRRRWGSDLVFVVSFDYLSIVERKNPLGAIEAFRRAFPVDAAREPAVRLVVKSINGDQRPDDRASIQAAVGGDERIDIVDEHLDHDRHVGLVAAADCLVSLHRSEGYGLHPALAMWLRTAVIATRYSGVVDFLDDECAAMVDFELVHVTKGQGIYPETAQWADPDLDQAAAAMRRLALDPADRDRLVDRAHRRIAGQPTAAQFGEAYAAVLSAGGDPRPGVEPFFRGLDRTRGPAQLARRWTRSGAAWPDTARR